MAAAQDAQYLPCPVGGCRGRVAVCQNFEPSRPVRTTECIGQTVGVSVGFGAGNAVVEMLLPPTRCLSDDDFATILAF